MDIFLIKIDYSNGISEELLHNFSHKNIKNDKVKQIHCLSYFMIDKILKDVYKLSDIELEFVNKKPFLKNRCKYLSVSHSGDYIVLGFSNVNCGIDVERIKKRDYRSIAKRMQFTSDNIIEFYKDWTMYEAKYKLSDDVGSFKTTQIEDYIITAVSSINENFELYIQNGNEFSNLSV